MVRAGCGPSSSDAEETCAQSHAFFLKFMNITLSYSHSRIFCLLNHSKNKDLESSGVEFESLEVLLFEVSR